MVKEKFDRNKKPKNIGEIGKDNITHSDYARAIELFQYFEEEARKRNEQQLKDLIGKYGPEVGYEKYQKLIEERQQYFREDINKGNRR